MTPHGQRIPIAGSFETGKFAICQGKMKLMEYKFFKAWLH